MHKTMPEHLTQWSQVLETFIEWCRELVVRVHSRVQLPVMEAYISKYRGLIHMLVRLSAAKSRAYHGVKVFFDGTIERSTPSDHQTSASDLCRISRQW